MCILVVYSRCAQSTVANLKESEHFRRIAQKGFIRYRRELVWCHTTLAIVCTQEQSLKKMLGLNYLLPAPVYPAKNEVE